MSANFYAKPCSHTQDLIHRIAETTTKPAECLVLRVYIIKKKITDRHADLSIYNFIQNQMHEWESIFFAPSDILIEPPDLLNDM